MQLDDLFDLKGKVALVTGAGQGLGQEIAQGLAHFNASLVLADRLFPGETQELIHEMGKSCVAFQTDISREEAVQTLARKAMETFGKVDILVNNAGVTQLGFTASESLSVEEWDRVLEINLKGTFLCCREVGKVMIPARGGSIVNIASTAGIRGIQRAPAYCASKSGIISLTQSLALEWARYNIRVNAVAPHYLETSLTQGLRDSEKIHTAITKQIPLGRLGKPREVFGAVLYLASEASTFTTGTVIPVDGGFLA